MRSSAPIHLGASEASGAPALPDFPWDTVAEQAALARAHPDGVVDLSVGTPVDEVPASVRAALASAADQPGYPWAAGTPELRAAAADALKRRYGVVGVEPDAVLPTIGSKELVAWLPTLLGVGPGELVAIPELAYPTYEVGAMLAGAGVVRLAPGEQPPAGTRLVWLNSPSNPTGRVSTVGELRDSVAAARARGAVVASDECYLFLHYPPGDPPLSVLDPAVHDGRLDGLLAVHSLSKSSNLAGYRAGFVAGDAALVARLLAVRRHAGMLVPRPVQAAMTAALGDDAHIAEQRARYAARRAALLAAVRAAGFAVTHSVAGLYLWITRDEPCRRTLDWFARRGILVAPGDFYGPRGARHVRLALTAPDERIATAVARLAR
jgi:succinyldiaminopimelate transaminase